MLEVYNLVNKIEELTEGLMESKRTQDPQIALMVNQTKIELEILLVTTIKAICSRTKDDKN